MTSSSSPVPWGFVGASRLVRARELLPAAWAEWQQAWCFQKEDQAAVLVESVTPADSGGTTWLHARVPAGGLWLGFGEDENWHRLVFGPVEQAPQDALATALIADARLALVNTVLQALEQAPVSGLTTDVSAFPGHTCPRLVLHTADKSVALLLDASLLDAALPVSAPAETLLKREQVIGSARVKLRVSLPLSSVSAATLTQLRVGDVLPTTTPLSRSFELTLSDARQAGGFLVRAGADRALQLADH